MQIMIDEVELQELKMNPWFGCLTRVALIHEIRRRQLDPDEWSLIYFDVDDLKKANNLWGKQESSLRIRNGVRSVDLLGSWFSGDEFVAIVPNTDAEGLANRIQRQLRENGMSATFVIDWFESLEDIDSAEEYVSRVKSLCKGCVIDRRMLI